MTQTPQSETVNRLDGFDSWVEAELAKWKIPGAAVAVVHRGEVILSKGYGLRDVEQSLPVTPETLFAIGSCSKAFTAFDIALLAEDGRLTWDTPVREYLPDFRLNDPVATEQTTARDLCSHRTGLPRHDFVWYGSPHSREELFQRLRYLKPNKPFRYGYEYQNLMFMTAGYLVGKVAGSGWEQFTQARIFDPLGMTSSNFSVEVSKTAENAALPYEEQDDAVVAIPFRNLDAVGPAGSINSNLTDMLRWLKLNMTGTHEGTELLPRAALRRMHTPHTVIPVTPDLPWSEYTEIEHTSYALGWATLTYRGHTMIRHTGGIDGFITWVSFLPNEDIGVIIMTNLGGNVGASVIHWHLYDRLLGLDHLPWSERIQSFFDNLKAKGEEGKQAVLDSRKDGTQPSHPLADYAGAYQHAAYGKLTVRQEGDGLFVSYNGLEYALRHHHYDMFLMTGADASVNFFLLVEFQTGFDGSIHAFAAALEPSVEPLIFERVPDGEGQ